MRDIEKELKAAFDSMNPPVGLNAATLLYIESKRGGETADASLHASGSSAEGGASLRTLSPAAARSSARPPHRKGHPLARAKMFLAAACVALAAFGVGYHYASTTATAFVDVDINPSVGIGLNTFNKVVSVTAYNEDGEKVISGIDARGFTLDEAILAISQRASEGGYLSADSFMQISVAGEDDRQVRSLEDQAIESLSDMPCEASCERVGMDGYHAARSAGMGMGKYSYAKKLVEADPTLSVEECSRMTMRELRDAAAARGIDGAVACEPCEHTGKENCPDCAAAGEQAQVRERRHEGRDR